MYDIQVAVSRYSKIQTNANNIKFSLYLWILFAADMKLFHSSWPYKVVNGFLLTFNADLTVKQIILCD